MDNPERVTAPAPVGRWKFPYKEVESSPPPCTPAPISRCQDGLGVQDEPPRPPPRSLLRDGGEGGWGCRREGNGWKEGGGGSKGGGGSGQQGEGWG